MKQNKDGLARKKRVRIQQNCITVLCLGCIIFSAVWSVHAAKTNKQNIQTENPVSNISRDSSSDNAIDSSSGTSSSETGSSKKDNSEISASSEKESSDESKDSNSSEKDNSKNDSSDKDSSESESSSENSQDENTHPYAQPSDTKDNLEDTAFIGDSRTVGLRNSSTKPKADFFCEVGLHVDTVLTEKSFTLDNGNAGTAIDALAQKQYKRVYINFGTNELGWPYPEVFKEKYTQLINKVREVQPNAVIYAESVLPVTASKDAEGGSVNNTNVKKFNKTIEEAAKETGIKYLDCAEAVQDKNGVLPEEASTDGVHLSQQYCLYWQNYIIDKT